MHCSIDHIVLNMEDEEKMIAFYTAVLMLKPDRLEAYRAAEVPFPSVRLNSETIIDLFPKKLWQSHGAAGPKRDNLNHLCIAMSQQRWTELLERLKSNDVEIEEGPALRWGARGFGTSIYFRDPDGNYIEARYYQEP